MNNIDLLRKIQEVNGYKYALVREGVCYNLLAMDEIPKEHIAYGELPEDGLYQLSRANCGAKDCDIGEPAQRCIENSTYNSNKCAVYFLYELSTICLTYDELDLIVDKR